jgi:hypothetical protein
VSTKIHPKNVHEKFTQKEDFSGTKVSGCPTKGHFTDKSGKNAFLSVKWPFIGQPENFIC